MKTQKQTNSPAWYAMAAGETLSEIAGTSGVAAAGLPPRDRGPTPISLLHRLGTAYRLSRGRYRQRQSPKSQVTWNETLVKTPQGFGLCAARAGWIPRS